MKIRRKMETVSIPRLKSRLEKGGEPLMNQIFTSSEQAYCSPKRMKFENYAARLAAKRAVLKLLGRKSPSFAEMREIEILKRPTGKPYIHFTSEVFPQAMRFEVSLAHERLLGLALVYAVSED